MEKQIKLFLDFLKNDKKLSENTLQSYQRDIVQFANYLKQNKMNFTEATEKEINTYLNSLNKLNKKTSTISRNLASIRSFYQFSLRNKKVNNDPTENIGSPK